MQTTAAIEKKTEVSSLTSRPPLEPRACYSIKQAAHVVGVSMPTIWRVLGTRELACLRAGRRVVITGQQLLDWLKVKEVDA